MVNFHGDHGKGMGKGLKSQNIHKEQEKTMGEMQTGTQKTNKVWQNKGKKWVVTQRHQRHRWKVNKVLLQ